MFLTPSLAGLHQLACDEAHCWCASLDLPPEASARLYATLSADERSRSARFRFERDRERFIVAHGVLRELLGCYLQTRPGRITYVYNAFGKPDLGPEFGGRLRFSLSHSEGLALIAIAAHSNVGVDLEYVRAQSDYAEIARCFFSAAEADQLTTLPDHLYAEAFISCWTRKEAYLKARGDGLTIPLNSFSVPPATDAAPGPVDPDPASSDIVAVKRWCFHELQPAPGYLGALAVEGGGWRLSRLQWTMCQG